jgi:hypothetical protein
LAATNGPSTLQVPGLEAARQRLTEGGSLWTYYPLMPKILYLYGGLDFHPTEAGEKNLSEVRARDGRCTPEMTRVLDALAALPGGA